MRRERQVERTFLLTLLGPVGDCFELLGKCGAVAVGIDQRSNLSTLSQ
jgi:hypothetical protein